MRDWRQHHGCVAALNWQLYLNSPQAKGQFPVYNSKDWDPLAVIDFPPEMDDRDVVCLAYDELYTCAQVAALTDDELLRMGNIGEAMLLRVRNLVPYTGDQPQRLVYRGQNE
jgi:hypothetical protein